MATQGVPTSQKFKMESSDFTAEFTANIKIDAPTVIYVNQPYYYPSGYNYTLSATSSQVTVDDSDSRYLKFQVTDPALDGTTIKVEITKKI